MAETDCNADGHANDLYTSLTADAPTPPVVNLSNSEYEFVKDPNSVLYQNVTGVTLQELTEVSLEGEGVFDKLMKSVDLHIQREYKGNRITGDQYANVYTQVTQAVLGQSTSFLLQKDQSKWAAITAQMEARIAEIRATEALVNLERVKVETQKSIFEMENAGAEYALTKMKIANADAEYCLTKAQGESEKYRHEFLMPAELSIQEYTRNNILTSEYAAKQVTADRILPAEAAMKEFQHREMLPVERDIRKYELAEGMPVKVDIDKYQLNSMLPVELAKEQHFLKFQMPAQTNLIKEQYESQRGNTMNTRSDGITPISGMLALEKQIVEKDIEAKNYNITQTLPIQLDLVKEQRESQRAQTMDTRSDGTTPVSGLLGKQKDSVVQDIASKQFNVQQVLPIQLDLVKEQREAERSKTLDTRTDNVVVSGSVGKQKDLYTQQIDSFIKDAKYKTAKMYLDGWITQKTLDENFTIPSEMQTPAIQQVLAGIRSANNL